MTKDAYYEMCELLEQEPDPDQIPVEFDDLPDMIQQTLEIYSFLPDRWEGMSATFMGKDYSIVFELLNTYDIESSSDKRLLLRFMSIVDSIRSKLIQDKHKQREKKPSK